MPAHPVPASRRAASKRHTMKKTYISPVTTVMTLHMEGQMLAASLPQGDSSNDDEKIGGDEVLSKDRIWDDASSSTGDIW